MEIRDVMEAENSDATGDGVERNTLTMEIRDEREEGVGKWPSTSRGTGGVDMSFI